MRNKRIITLVVALFLMLLQSSCSSNNSAHDDAAPATSAAPATPVISATPPSTPGQPSVDTPDSQHTMPSESPPLTAGQIYLYGEVHGLEVMYDKVFELWYEHYNNENMRHYFIEFGYFTAEFLNIWMQSDNDVILYQLYTDWRGTQSHNPYIRDFFGKIKSECPDTIFHGVDIGHQYHLTGARYLEWLEGNGLENSEQYLLAQEAIEQGKRYSYENPYIDGKDHAYRENMMAENFMREFDKLNGESVMGNFGNLHTYFDAMNSITYSVPSMAHQLRERYGDAVHSEDLTWLTWVIEPYSVDLITVNGTEYTASYFGKQNMTWVPDYAYREFWRLENTYDDFKDMPKTGDVFPYYAYPMEITDGQVFILDVYKRDGSFIRAYFRSDGYIWNGLPSTEEFTIG